MLAILRVKLLKYRKKERVAEIKKIRTGLVENTQSEEHGQSRLEVTLTRGEFGHLVSDFRRRKVIEVFEIHDRDLTGIITGDKIRQLNPAHEFHADNTRQQKATDFLKKNDDQLNLPAWIHYCSILIHPLLLEYHFKTAIRHFGGIVDVHDGDLPTKMSEAQILYLQRMGLYDNENQEDVMDLNVFDSTFNQWNENMKKNENRSNYNFDDANVMNKNNNIQKNTTLLSNTSNNNGFHNNSSNNNDDKV